MTKYGLGQVTTAKLGPKCVTTAKIADSAVQTLQIDDGAIVNADVNAAAAIVRSKLTLPTLVGVLRNDKTAANTSANAWADLYVTAISNAEAAATKILVHVQAEGAYTGSFGGGTDGASCCQTRVVKDATQVGAIRNCGFTSANGGFGFLNDASLTIALVAGVDYTLNTGFNLKIQGQIVERSANVKGGTVYYQSSIIYMDY